MGFRAQGVARKIVRIETELAPDEGKHRLRDRLARPEQASRIPERAELQGEAQPIARPMPLSDMREILVAQDAVAHQRRLVGRQGEQRLALPGGQDGASGHARHS